MKFRIESTFNHSFILKALAKSLSAEGVDGGYNQLELNLRNSASELHGTKYDWVGFLFDVSQIDHDEDYFFRIFELIAEFSSSKKVTALVSTLPLQALSKFGHLEANSKIFSYNQKIGRINQKLLDLSHDRKGVFIYDINQSILLHGHITIYDPRMLYVSKSPFSLEGISIIARSIADLVRSIFTPRKKVIVLDLDNTLWKGIVGEDGASGIGFSEDGPNKSFYDFQVVLRAMMDRGVILALCSKNNLADVEEAFATRQDLILQWDDFVIKKINWEDKAKNILEISQELNLALESFVFLDDNPAERQWVKASFPEILVPELPKEFAEYSEFVLQIEELKVSSYTQEDSNRISSYKAESKRNNLKSASISFMEFLQSLKIHCSINDINSETISRSSQLFMRSNQFNLTTKRYTESEIAGFIENDSYLFKSLSVNDKFGDYGIVGVVLMKKTATTIEIDSFLISCRVLGKGIEEYFLKKSILLSQDIWGERPLIASYSKTAKNAQVQNFYETHSFSVLKESDELKSYELKEFSEIGKLPEYVNVCK